MPCNGQLYIPPHQCFCYQEAKLNGFNALTNEIDSQRWKSKDPLNRRLEKGSAFQMKNKNINYENEWPTYRHDPKRSGSINSSIPEKLDQLWKVNVGNKISQPVVAEGKVFVASMDAQRISCLDAINGKILWQYTAGGRIDSPPTIYKSRVLFGSTDGWVYCLRVSDGELVWRFQAAPQDRRVIAFNQLESAWPVHGSILVEHGVAYFAAGRSSFLDGGIYVYGINPETGEKLHETRLDGPHPNLFEEPGRPFDMEGALPDILVSQDNYIYMRNIKFDNNLLQQEIPRITQLGDRKIGLHLFSTSASGLLDDTWWDRAIWMYSDRWPGFYFGIQAPKTGQILVFNDSTTYGLKCYTSRNVHSPWFNPGSGYLLFADKNSTESLLVEKDGTPNSVKWLPELNETLSSIRKLDFDDPAVDYEKGPGFSRTQPPEWMKWIPIRVRAMLLSKNALFIAGPPDVIDPADPLGAFEGRKGAHLWVISVSSGNKIAEYKLDTPPVFDGMAAAEERLYLSTIDNYIYCYGKKN
jgi:hypothetical protein